MRLADYVIQYLEDKGIGHCFTVCGGGSIFLNDALAKARSMKYISHHHEQAAAMAAEGYARVRTGLGLTMVTSGPGGTNAITGVAGAWTDCVPTITISGQVFSSQTVKGHPGLRTMGVQEIDIVPIVKPITKYAVQVSNPENIRYELERAIHYATTGRPGPVWLDIPADCQNAKIDPAKLGGFVAADKQGPSKEEAQAAARQVRELLKEAKRPLLHVGQGVRLAGAIPKLFDLIEQLGIPVVTARNANDIIDSDHPCYIGRPGTFAQRGANFAVQTCDLYIAIGTRLCLAQTGYNAKDYARRAKVVMVDIDRPELEKNTMPLHLKVHADAGVFLEALLEEVKGWKFDFREWLEKCKALQAKYPPVTEEQKTGRYVNSYHLVDELSRQLTTDDVIVTDMGFSFQCSHQAFRVKKGQRLFTNGGLAPMGWGLPAAIGAAVGSGKRVICITGDGGLMFNAQELSTVHHHNLPIKIFVLNNGGYLTMRQSQAHAFDGYMGSDESSGVSFPDFRDLAHAHYLPECTAYCADDMPMMVAETLQARGAMLCEVKMDPDQPQIPKSVNRRDEAGNIKQTAIEDAWPYLPREEIEENLKLQ